LKKPEAGRLSAWHRDNDEQTKKEMRTDEQGTDERRESIILVSLLLPLIFFVRLFDILYASFFGAAGALPVVFFSLAGLDLPKDPLNILPFLVFLSPLPIIKF
jgi:hypothetical protein